MILNRVLSGVHHVAINASNIEKSIRFYHEILGLELLFPPQNGSGKDLERAVRIPGAKLRYAMLQASGTLVELIQYVDPSGDPYDRRNCDIGNAHLAFRVLDIKKVYAELKRKGVKFNSPPLEIGEGPLKGCAFAYFTDPDGVTLELFQE